MENTLEEIEYSIIINNYLKPIHFDEILQMRLNYKSISEIASVVGLKDNTIYARLIAMKSIVDDETAKELYKVDEHFRKFKNNKRPKKGIAELSNYELGILWSLGRYDKSKDQFIISCQDDGQGNEYFIEQFSRITNKSPRTTIAGKKLRHYLITYVFDIKELRSIGWAPEDTITKEVPVLDDYKDFIRSYIETKGTIDYYPVKTSKGVVNYRVRLRIYGDYAVLDKINTELSIHTNSIPKKIFVRKNTDLAYLYYTSIGDLNNILDYVYGESNYGPYWDNYKHCLLNRVKKDNTKL